MNRNRQLTLERAKEVFRYDAAEGVLRWLIATGPRARIGEIAGGPNNSYTRVRVDGVRYYVHCIVWLMEHGSWPDAEIDHRDVCGANNRIKNLRQATLSQNRANMRIRSDNTSGVKGASKCGNRWRAQISTDRIVTYIGLFPTKEAAGQAYADVARARFGEFARTS